VLLNRSRLKNLDRIARLLSNYDVLRYRNADGGICAVAISIQVQYGEAAGIPYWYQQHKPENLGQFCPAQAMVC